MGYRGALRRTAIAFAGVVAVLALAAPAAEGTYTANVDMTSTIATFTPSSDPGGLLLIDASGANLTHNRSGDPGFASNQDFRSGDGAAVTTIPNNAGRSVVVDGAGGAVSVAVGGATPVSQILTPVTVNGNVAGSNFLSIGDAGDTTGRNWTVSTTQVSGHGGGAVNYSNVGQVTPSAGTGNDVFNVQSFNPAGVLNIQGNSGNDRLTPANGVTLGDGVFDGGPDTDTLDYSAYASPVTANLGVQTATGMLVVQGVENVTGGSGNDDLTGSSVPNVIDGGPGADTMHGADGNDTLNAADGTTDAVLDCGPGTGDVLNRDAASIDADSIVTGCETVNTAPEPSTGGGGVFGPAPQSSLSAINAKASGGGTFITIDTGATGACPATLTLSCALQAKATANVPKSAIARASAKTKRVTLGKLADSLRPGQAKRIKFKLSKKNSALWRKLKKLKISFTISVSTPGGQTARQAKTVTLKAPKKK